MRKTILVLATLGLAVLLASGLALAAPKATTTTTTRIDCSTQGSTSCQGTSGPDEIYGTDSADVIIPYGGDDIVYAGPGNDEVRHSFGNDYIEGGLGADTLRGGFDSDEIYANEPTTDVNGHVIDRSDDVRDLVDCAYLPRRDKGEAYDSAYAVLGEDTVVDCKTVHWYDTSQ
jgi:Ca2+-binding RTX toxin-like protein